MRAAALALATPLALAALPAHAQLSGGLGNFNAANQSFQLQNQLRGLQQQQTFDRNVSQLDSSVNRLNSGPAYGYGGYGGYGYGGYGHGGYAGGLGRGHGTRVIARPERER